MSDAYLQTLENDLTLPYVTQDEKKRLMIQAIKDDFREFKNDIAVLPFIDMQDKGQHIMQEYQNVKKILRTVMFGANTEAAPTVV